MQESDTITTSISSSDLEAATTQLHQIATEELDIRRMRIFRIPFDKLTTLINHPSILEGTRNSRVQFMTVPGRLRLPADARVVDAWENAASRSYDILIQSREFDPVPDGAEAPIYVEDIPRHQVVAVDPDRYADLERKANLWDSNGHLIRLKHSFRFRWVLRSDGFMWLYRICRFSYEVFPNRTPAWHSVEWTFGLVPTLYKFRREDEGWILRILGLRIHKKVCRGGRPG